MKIVVLAGGISTEREISIVSGSEVCRALRERGHAAILVDVYFGNDMLKLETVFDETYDLEAAISHIKQFDVSNLVPRKSFFGPNVLSLCEAADIVFMALHGESGENGKVQAAFDLLGIKYTGSGSLGSALAMDKWISKQLFFENNVPTPKGILIRHDMPRQSATEYGMNFPCMVKTCCGGSSVGVYLTRTEEEFASALTEAFYYEPNVVVEEYVKGREFSVAVVAGEAYPVIEIAPLEGFYDYTNKYQPGAAVETCPANISAEQTKQMQDYAVKACRALRIEGYGRIDFLMNDGGDMYCLEANTLPGMTPTSLIPQEAQALGMDFGQLCERLIQVSIG